MSRLLKKVGWGMIVFAVFQCAAFFSLAGAQEAEVVDRIVAVVNDEIISLFEMNQLLQPYEAKIRNLGYSSEREREMLFKVREEVLNQLIDQKLTDQETRRFRITVSKQEIDNAIERIKEANFYTDEQLRKGLARQGMTLEEYREKMREQMLRSRLLNIEVKSRIVITKEDIKSYYETHKELYDGEKKYHLRNIIMKVPALADEAEEGRIRAKMEMILEKLKAGQPFEDMAKQYSESPSAADGGELGVFAKDVLSPQIQETLKGMQAKEFTPILETDLGYQIFFVQDVIHAQGKTLEEAIPEVEQKLFKEVVDEKFQTWLEELRKRSHIKIVK